MDLKLYKHPMSLITVTGEKVRVTPGILARLSGALYEGGINVYCVSTGEYSLSFAVTEADGKRAAEALRRVIQRDCAFDSLTVEKNVALITVTGKELAEQSGVLVRLTEPLARKFINIVAVSSSYDSLSILLDWRDKARAFKLVESCFEKGALVEIYRPKERRIAKAK